MRAWVVRAGRHGENEDYALDNNIAVIGWDQLCDLTTLTTRDQIREQLLAVGYDERSRLGAHTGQVHRFAHEIEPDDIIVLPSKTAQTVAIGLCQDAYQHQPQNPPGSHHVRPVEWLRRHLPWDNLAQDLSFSITSPHQTVFEPRVDRAVYRLAVAAATGQDPDLPTPQTEPLPEGRSVAIGKQINHLDNRVQNLERRFTQLGHSFAQLFPQK